jgi:hypothetical protein
MSRNDDTQMIQEAGSETPTLDTRSEEDPKLYQDAEGGHAKIDTDKIPAGVSDKKNKGSIAGKAPGAGIEAPVPSGTSQERLEHHLDALFDGENLSEGFQTKAATIFEAAINERISEIEENLIEQYQNNLDENIEKVTTDLSEKLDDYLSYVVEQWMEENTIAVENGIRTDVAENFISGLKVLFENCYIDVPESKYDLVDELTTTKEELETQLNEALQVNIDLNSEILHQRVGEIFHEESNGLTDVEVEKLASLSEGIEFEDENQYRDKISILKESYFSDDPIMTEETETSSPQILTEGPMNKYMNTISRHTNFNKVS